MESTMLTLTQTDLPLHEMGINYATGTLDLIVYIDRAYPGVEEKIKEYTKDIPVVITYGKNTAKLQSECSSSTEYCNPPLVSGAKDENKYWGIILSILASICFLIFLLIILARRLRSDLSEKYVLCFFRKKRFKKYQ